MEWATLHAFRKHSPDGKKQEQQEEKKEKSLHNKELGPGRHFTFRCLAMPFYVRPA